MILTREYHFSAAFLRYSPFFTSRKFMRTLVADGNFKQDHLRMKNPSEDVSLSDGLGYMVGKNAFDNYIVSAPPLGKLVCDGQSIIPLHHLITNEEIDMS